MKIVKVTYAAKPAFVEENMGNIKTVMNDLEKLGYPGVFYHSCLSADGKTFIHTAFFKSEADHKLLNGLPSFIRFQQELKAKGLETPPQQESLTLVGSSSPIFR